MRANLDADRLADRATVVARRRAGVPRGRRPAAFDLALLDPPYAFDGWADLLGGAPTPTSRCSSATGPIEPRHRAGRW